MMSGRMAVTHESHGRVQPAETTRRRAMPAPSLYRSIGNQTTGRLLASWSGTPGSMNGIQRKAACGCGGGCPKCQEEQRSPIQAKLSVSQPGDVFEQEADRVADQVMSMPANLAVTRRPPQIQRYMGNSTCQANTEAATSVNNVLASPGRALEAPVREEMEHRFGRDFSGVRVHSDSIAQQSARDVNAHAYTAGQNIVFGAGHFAPATPEGQRLIAHELTHVVQQGASLRAPIQRKANPECLPFLERNKNKSVCKPPPSSQNVGNAAHTKIQEDFIKGQGQLKELPIPGSGNVCSQSKFEPEFAKGKVDLLKVTAVDSKNEVQVEIAEIKPLNIDGISLGTPQFECYRDHLKDVGKDCKELGKRTPAELNKARKNKDLEPRTRDALTMCDRLNAIGKKVTVKNKGLKIPAQSFTLFGRPMAALNCFDGVVCYTCLDPEQEERKDDRNPAAPRDPLAEATAAFIKGFLAGAKDTIPPETWTKLYATLSQPANYVAFVGGQAIGRPLGALANLKDLLEGLLAVTKLGIELSPAGAIGGELSALVKGKESPILHRVRIAKDLIEGLPQLVDKLKTTPDIFSETGLQFGTLIGKEAARKFLKEFVPASPLEMGIIVGKVEGYIALEIAMLFVGPEELGLKGISGAARILKGTRLGAAVLELLESIAALKRVLKALKLVPEVATEASKGAKVVEGATEAARGPRVAVEAEKELANDAEKALKAREAAKAEERARAVRELEEDLENIEEGAQKQGRVKSARN